MNADHKLYRISIRSKYSKTKKDTMYFISESKENCESYIKGQLVDEFYIEKIYYLGDALSGRLFKKS